MSISYSTNWMGPVRLDWFTTRGLTKKVMVPPGRFNKKEKEIDEITEYWSGGRIDIRGEGTGMFGDETSLPIMHGKDYNRFSIWLETYRTEEIQYFDQILEAYYDAGNPTIRFAHDYDFGSNKNDE